jgi:5-methyltetrahydropteroyltriglutamate--homocysteine methyltransferase
VRGSLVTTVVGSYPQPGWLIDREALAGRTPPRVAAHELWRVQADLLAEAQDDATALAVRDFERAGIDVVTDGEARRESYSSHFANALAGIDHDRPGTFVSRSGATSPAPRVVGPIRRTRPVGVRDVEFLRACTSRPIKATVPGPFTLARQTQDEHYGDARALALDFAAAVNQEVRDLFAAGADVVQLDEPYLQVAPEEAKAFGVEVVDRALEGAPGTTALHTCFGYGQFVKGKPAGYPFLDELNAASVDQISLEAAQPGVDPAVLRAIPEKTVIFGVVSAGDEIVESAELVAERIEAALSHIEPERLMPAPDCGMKYLPRDVAFAKLRALVEGATRVRAALS